MFEIDPASPRPIFFFLGSILKQNDLGRQESQNKDIPLDERPLKPRLLEDDLTQIHYQSTEKEVSPFAIKPITKPLKQGLPDSQQKEVIKATFDSEQEELPGEESGPSMNEPEIIIPSYKPLQFRTR